MGARRSLLGTSFTGYEAGKERAGSCIVVSFSDGQPIESRELRVPTTWRVASWAPIQGLHRVKVHNTLGLNKHSHLTSKTEPKNFRYCNCNLSVNQIGTIN